MASNTGTFRRAGTSLLHIGMAVVTPLALLGAAYAVAPILASTFAISVPLAMFISYMTALTCEIYLSYVEAKDGRPLSAFLHAFIPSALALPFGAPPIYAKQGALMGAAYGLMSSSLGILYRRERLNREAGAPPPEVT